MKSPAAVNRYIYYPDHIVRLPSPIPGLSVFDNLKNMLQTIRDEPLFEGLLSGLLLEFTKPARPQQDWQEDESVASFISRRFGPNVADNLVSAIFHGIYAGDIDRMSAQYMLGQLRDLEDVGVVYGSLSRAVNKKRIQSMDDFLALINCLNSAVSSEGPIKRVLGAASTFTLKDGTQQLIEGLEKVLRNTEKVQIKTDTDIDSISQMQDSKMIRVSHFNQLGFPSSEWTTISLATGRISQSRQSKF